MKTFVYYISFLSAGLHRWINVTQNREGCPTLPLFTQFFCVYVGSFIYLYLVDRWNPPPKKYLFVPSAYFNPPPPSPRGAGFLLLPLFFGGGPINQNMSDFSSGSFSVAVINYNIWELGDAGRRGRGRRGAVHLHMGDAIMVCFHSPKQSGV